MSSAGDATTAIIAGKIDAVFLPAPGSGPPLKRRELGRSLFIQGEMESDHACRVLVASGDMIRNHPDIVQEVMSIHQKATEYNQQNITEAGRLHGFSDWYENIHHHALSAGVGWKVGSRSKHHHQVSHRVRKPAAGTRLHQEERYPAGSL